MPKPNLNRASDLLASITQEMVPNGLNLANADKSIRVEPILLELVRPHPVQPRRVLPERIHLAFHQEQLTPTQALRELIQLVQVAARQRSRPFQNVLELVTTADDDAEPGDPVQLSPEELLLRDLVNLAVTIRDDGQVNPLTVVDVSAGVSRLYRIETGERRYWATWLLRDFIPDSGSDGTIPCIVIPSRSASVFRQARENTSRSGLTAIAMARQAALLLLAVHGVAIPDYPVTNDFYRQALELDLRAKREYTDSILAAMGGIGKMHFSRYKALLQLTDEALEMADRYAIDERRLRYVVPLQTEAQVELIRQIITYNLSSRQIEEICRSGDPSTADEEEPILTPKSIKAARVLNTLSDSSPGEIAAALLRQEPDMAVARLRIQSALRLLTEVDRTLASGKGNPGVTFSEA